MRAAPPGNSPPRVVPGWEALMARRNLLRSLLTASLMLVGSRRGRGVLPAHARRCGEPRLTSYRSTVSDDEPFTPERRDAGRGADVAFDARPRGSADQHTVTFEDNGNVPRPARSGPCCAECVQRPAAQSVFQLLQRRASYAVFQYYDRYARAQARQRHSVDTIVRSPMADPPTTTAAPTSTTTTTADRPRPPPGRRRRPPDRSPRTTLPPTTATTAPSTIRPFLDLRAADDDHDDRRRQRCRLGQTPGSTTTAGAEDKDKDKDKGKGKSKASTATTPTTAAPVAPDALPVDAGLRPAVADAAARSSLPDGRHGRRRR